MFVHNNIWNSNLCNEVGYLKPKSKAFLFCMPKTCPPQTDLSPLFMVNSWRVYSDATRLILTLEISAGVNADLLIHFAISFSPGIPFFSVSPPPQCAFIFFPESQRSNKHNWSENLRCGISGTGGSLQLNHLRRWYWFRPSSIFLLLLHVPGYRHWIIYIYIYMYIFFFFFIFVIYLSFNILNKYWLANDEMQDVGVILRFVVWKNFLEVSFWGLFRSS